MCILIFTTSITHRLEMFFVKLTIDLKVNQKTLSHSPDKNRKRKSLTNIQTFNFQALEHSHTDEVKDKQDIQNPHNKVDILSLTFDDFDQSISKETSCDTIGNTI